MTIKFTDRYKALGIPYPDPKIMCLGQCEGTGVVPVLGPRPPGYTGSQTNSDPKSIEDMQEPWKSLWEEAEENKPSTDGWHFVTCPDCEGTGRR